MSAARRLVLMKNFCPTAHNETNINISETHCDISIVIASLKIFCLTNRVCVCI